MDTYSHLYPNKQVEVAKQLDDLIPQDAPQTGYKKQSDCSQFVASPKMKIPEVPIKSTLPGQKRSNNHYSHSMQSIAFSLIFASPVRSRDSDSTDYLYSPCSTASVYHFFISVIKRLFCCGLRGLFPWNHYSISPMLKQAFSIFLLVYHGSVRQFTGKSAYTVDCL